jgi:hypothetical protein
MNVNRSGVELLRHLDDSRLPPPQMSLNKVGRPRRLLRRVYGGWTYVLQTPSIPFICTGMEDPQTTYVPEKSHGSVNSGITLLHRVKR